MFMERSSPPPRLFGFIGWSIVAVVFVGVIVYGLSVYLNWIVLQSMYASKAGLNWFAINFYHNNTFIVAGVLALLFINPIPRRSHLFEALSALGGIIRACQRGRGDRSRWALARLHGCFGRWSSGLLPSGLIASANGIPGLGNFTIVITMLAEWDGQLGPGSEGVSAPVGSCFRSLSLWR